MARAMYACMKALSMTAETTASGRGAFGKADPKENQTPVVHSFS